MQEELNILRQRIDTLEALFHKDNFNTTQIFRKDIQITGKIGLYGVAPIAQAGAIASPSGGATVDSQARTAIDSIRTAIKNIGISA